MAQNSAPYLERLTEAALDNLPLPEARDEAERRDLLAFTRSQAILESFPPLALKPGWEASVWQRIDSAQADTDDGWDEDWDAADPTFRQDTPNNLSEAPAAPNVVSLFPASPPQPQVAARPLELPAHERGGHVIDARSRWRSAVWPVLALAAACLLVIVVNPSPDDGTPTLPSPASSNTSDQIDLAAGAPTQQQKAPTSIARADAPTPENARARDNNADKQFPPNEAPTPPPTLSAQRKTVPPPAQPVADLPGSPARGTSQEMEEFADAEFAAVAPATTAPPTDAPSQASPPPMPPAAPIATATVGDQTPEAVLGGISPDTVSPSSDFAGQAKTPTDNTKNAQDKIADKDLYAARLQREAQEKEKAKDAVAPNADPSAGAPYGADKASESKATGAVAGLPVPEEPSTTDTSTPTPTTDLIAKADAKSNEDNDEASADGDAFHFALSPAFYRSGMVQVRILDSEGKPWGGAEVQVLNKSTKEALTVRTTSAGYLTLPPEQSDADLRLAFAPETERFSNVGPRSKSQDKKENKDKKDKPADASNTNTKPTDTAAGPVAEADDVRRDPAKAPLPDSKPAAPLKPTIAPPKVAPVLLAEVTTRHEEGSKADRAETLAEGAAVGRVKTLQASTRRQLPAKLPVDLVVISLDGLGEAEAALWPVYLSELEASLGRDALYPVDAYASLLAVPTSGADGKADNKVGGITFQAVITGDSEARPANPRVGKATAGGGVKGELSKEAFVGLSPMGNAADGSVLVADGDLLRSAVLDSLEVSPLARLLSLIGWRSDSIVRLVVLVASPGHPLLAPSAGLDAALLVAAQQGVRVVVLTPPVDALADAQSGDAGAGDAGLHNGVGGQAGGQAVTDGAVSGALLELINAEISVLQP